MIVYECFHCLARAVIWDADFSFEDYGEEGEGIYQICHCTNCGAEITYKFLLEMKMKGVMTNGERTAV